MLKFNELRIDEDKNLIIDFIILDTNNEYYDTISISSIKVGINSNEYTKEFASGLGTEGIFDNIVKYTKTIKTSPTSEETEATIYRGFRLVLNLDDDSPYNPWEVEDISLQDPYKYLVYVNVVVEALDYRAVMDGCLQEKSIEGYAYNRCLVVNKVFDYLKEYDTPCADITNLANYITQINGVQIAIESNRFELARKYWNKFFAKNDILSTHSNCNCCH